MCNKMVMISKTAFSFYNGRVAPVFDCARSVLIIISEGPVILDRYQEEIGFLHPQERAGWLKERDVEALVCGAISRPLKETIEHMGIRVAGFISGESGEVIEAWLNDEDLNERYLMPGCVCSGRRGLDGDCDGSRRRRRRGCRTE